MSFYITMAFFAEFFAPYPLEAKNTRYINAPPQIIRFVDANGKFHLRPFVYVYQSKMDMATFSRVFTEDTSKPYPIRFFVQGEPYRLLGLIPAKTRLFGVD